MNKFCILILLSLIISACNTDSSDFEIGTDLIDTESSVFLTDTFSVKFSSVQLDSIVASSASTAIIGKYNHDKTGNLNIKHFFNIDPTTVDDENILDSITIRLNYSEYYLGDTLNPIEFSVYRLSEELEIEDEPNISPDYNYNTTQVNYSTSDLVGTYQFSARPTNDSIEFKINTSLGNELFDWLADDDISDGKTDRFRTFVKGFVIEQTGGEPLILGFDNSEASNIQVLLYTHEDGLNNDVVKYELNRAADNTNFSQVNIDRSGSLFEDMVEQDEDLSSEFTEGLGLIQEAAGGLCKVNFPSINDIFTLPNTTLIRSELVLVPSFTENDIDNLPPTIYFYQTNRYNELDAALADSEGDYLSATLTIDKLNNIYYYAVDITSYMSAQLADYDYDENSGLIMSLTSPSSSIINTADVLLLSDTEKLGGLETKLNLYFLKNE